MTRRSSSGVRAAAAAVLASTGFAVLGPLASPALGGFGTVTSLWGQLWIQAKGVGFTIAWSAVLSFVLLKLIDKTLGLRVDDEQEMVGLDIALHEEKAYNLS